MSEDTNNVISDTDRKFAAEITNQILAENPTEEQLAKNLVIMSTLRILKSPSGDTVMEQIRKLSVFIALLITELRKAKTTK